MDVIDDLETEQKEVINTGNTFFTYSYDIHTCRMAGCYSIISDLLDEEPLNIFYMNKLCKELVNSPKNLPHWESRKEYIEYLNILNVEVYDLYYQKFNRLINTYQVNRIILKYQTLNRINKIWDIYKNHIIIFFIILVLIILRCIFN